MKIEIKEGLKIEDIVEGYENNGEEGVVGFGGKLNIRPKYQREFIYEKNEQVKVIDSVIKNYPLNVMYWVKSNDKNFDYEVLDGQQRIISFCEYVAEGHFAIKYKGNEQYYHNLNEKIKDKINKYNRFVIYLCEGNEKEIIEWFEIINIVGKPLNHQEILNAVYSGSWVSSAKTYFSKSDGQASIGKNFVKGSLIRQDFLKTAIEWHLMYLNSGNFNFILKNEDKKNYMAEHQNEENAEPLWKFFEKVVDWIKKIIPEHNDFLPLMKKTNWGFLYAKYYNQNLDAKKIKAEINRAIEDDNVSKKSGVIEYAITGDDKFIKLRTFDSFLKRKIWKKQNKKCKKCSNSIDLKEAHADHIKPWSKGGRTTEENCQILCQRCNASKGATY